MATRVTPRPIAWSEPGRTTREITTGGWRTRRPLYVETTAPCRAACPAGEPIALWIERARRGDYAGAWSLLRQENPLPAVTGRVCGHPCEAACNRASHDGAVAINALERFVGDWGLDHGGVAPVPLARPRRVAVVGGGPAGLACAYHLAREGYPVTLFEGQPRLGGLLRYGIPDYRLPAAVLDREIELTIGLGIEVMTGRRLGRNLSWADLSAWDAVFLATGAPVPLALGVPGEHARGVVDALAFLHDVNAGPPPPMGRTVLVVGGGSTAMDAARSALRLGAATATVLALEERAAMPALAEEIAQARAEGVRIANGVGVRRFLEGAGGVTGVVVSRARLGRAGDGTVGPVFESEERSVLAADTVVLAIGQRPDPAVLPPAVGAARGLVEAAPSGATPDPRLFAGGDATSSHRTVADALGAGTRAARAIHASLSSERRAAYAAPHAGAELRPDHVVAAVEIGRHHFAPAPRAQRAERPAAARLASFVEVVHGLGEPAARAEAARCFTCGRCIDCDTCLAVCPDMAISRAGDAYRVSLEHCKGCGLCAAECPRGALAMVSER